jgi:hypothetical protein
LSVVAVVVVAVVDPTPAVQLAAAEAQVVVTAVTLVIFPPQEPA